MVIFLYNRNFFWGLLTPVKFFYLIKKFIFFNPLYEEIFLLGFVREASFIWQKYNKMHLRLVTPYILISSQNATIRKLYFIIACNIYSFQFFWVVIMCDGLVDSIRDEINMCKPILLHIGRLRPLFLF